MTFDKFNADHKFFDETQKAFRKEATMDGLKALGHLLDCPEFYALNDALQEDLYAQYSAKDFEFRSAAI